MQYEFTARDLNGNVCMTRNAVQAKQQGTFTRYTYYSPYFRYSGSDYTTLLEGSYYALREPLTLSEEYIAEHPDRGLKSGMQARRGTELMLYLPSSLAYSSSGASSDAGYGGQYELDALRDDAQRVARDVGIGGVGVIVLSGRGERRRQGSAEEEKFFHGIVVMGCSLQR